MAMNGNATELLPPPEFADELYVSTIPLDGRSDEEIMASLTQRPPSVTSEKNVWAFWHTGFSSMPGWCQRNVVGWVRKLGPEWNVRVLDKIPGSPTNALNFVPASMLPEAYSNETMTGPWIGQHSADMIRTACIYQHGGVWVDVGCILLMHLDHLCWNQLEDPTTSYEICVPLVRGQIIANNFIASRKGSQFVWRWHQLFKEVWKGKESAEGLSSHPLLEIPPPPPKETNGEESDSAEAQGFAFPFKVPFNVVKDYVAQITACHKTSLVKEAGENGFDGPAYWSDKVLTFKSIDEVFGADKLTAFNQQALFDMLACPVPGNDAQLTDEQRELQVKAEKLTWHMVSRAAMLKVYNGKNLLKAAALGELWTMPENEGADCRPGTFAALLRQASIVFEQKRAMPYITSPKVEVVVEGPLF